MGRRKDLLHAPNRWVVLLSFSLRSASPDDRRRHCRYAWLPNLAFDLRFLRRRHAGPRRENARGHIRRPPAQRRKCAHAHPNSVAARKGYAKNGKGSDRGVKARPTKISTATTANKSDAMNPMPLTTRGMTLGALTRASDAAHNATPAPNNGVLAARSMAAAERITASPTTKTRKPAATTSSPRHR